MRTSGNSRGVPYGALSLAMLIACGPARGPAAPTPPAPAPVEAAPAPIPPAPDAGALLEGIDVSHYQGEIDWSAVAEGDQAPVKVHLAVAKATEGRSLDDPKFERNFAAMKAAGLIRGAYAFYRPGVDPKQQATHFIEKVQLEPGDLPPVIDIELMGKSAEDKRHLVRDLHILLDALEAHYGVKPIIYTGVPFWNAHMDGSFGEHPLWVAYYAEQPKLPVGWEKWTFWQHTAEGSVDGVSRPVDLSRYCCSLAELRSLTVPSPLQAD